MYIIILVTVGNEKEARRIARELVAQRLAACVNIISQVESFFKWKGKLDRAKEFILVIKSKKGLFSKVVALVKKMHSYEVPEIISLAVPKGERKYMEWWDECLG